MKSTITRLTLSTVGIALMLAISFYFVIGTSAFFGWYEALLLETALLCIAGYPATQDWHKIIQVISITAFVVVIVGASTLGKINPLIAKIGDLSPHEQALATMYKQNLNRESKAADDFGDKNPSNLAQASTKARIASEKLETLLKKTTGKKASIIDKATLFAWFLSRFFLQLFNLALAHCLVSYMLKPLTNPEIPDMNYKKAFDSSKVPMIEQQKPLIVQGTPKKILESMLPGIEAIYMEETGKIGIVHHNQVYAQTGNHSTAWAAAYKALFPQNNGNGNGNGKHQREVTSC